VGSNAVTAKEMLGLLLAAVNSAAAASVRTGILLEDGEQQQRVAIRWRRKGTIMRSECA
jgi:hypothetical protein